MIQHQVKLKLTKHQERDLDRYLYHLTSVWNWAIKKIEHDARDHVYHSPKGFQNLLTGHSVKLEIPSHVLQGVLVTAHESWRRCFKGISRRPRLRGRRKKLTSILFPDPIKTCNGRVALLGVGRVRYHKQELPEGKIKRGRVVKRASGWYLCLFIDAEPNAISRVADGRIGIDPGFKDLLTLSTGEKIVHPQEFRVAESRLAQAQRGGNKQLTARIQERTANRRKDRNHKLSRRLVSENVTICFLKDNHRAIAKRFGKSVADSGHGQLRDMLSYKCRTGDAELIFPENRNSTRTCSTCGALTGPTGLAGLKVREWDCAACGSHHDRDTNSSRNALIFGVGTTHEMPIAALKSQHYAMSKAMLA